jgi:glyceraldehyde-3-phosphate dehydrogenase (ferredoxin)
MLPEIMGSLYGKKEPYLERIAMTASRINSRNSSVFWESDRNADFVLSYLQRQQEVEGIRHGELLNWIDEFRKDKHAAAFNFWYEIHKGTHESLREF